MGAAAMGRQQRVQPQRMDLVGVCGTDRRIGRSSQLMTIMRLVLRGKGRFSLDISQLSGEDRVNAKSSGHGTPMTPEEFEYASLDADEPDSSGSTGESDGRRSSSTVHSPQDVYEHLCPRFAGCMQEIFLVVALDARNGVIDIIEMARGCLTHVEVHPREVFRPLTHLAAASVVVAHNHPSGDPTPSQQDIVLSMRLRVAGDIMGIPVLDHLVVGDGRYVSIAARERW